MSFSKARRSFDKKRIVIERTCLANGTRSSEGEVIERGNDKSGERLRWLELSDHETTVVGRLTIRERSLSLRWHPEANVKGYSLPLAVCIHEREIVFADPFRVKAGGNLEDEVTGVQDSCFHWLDPLGEIVSTEVLLEELTDT